MSEDDRVQYKFMIPSALKERIEDAAHSHRRSLSAEIIAALSRAYPPPPENVDMRSTLNDLREFYRSFPPEERERVEESVLQMLRSAPPATTRSMRPDASDDAPKPRSMRRNINLRKK